jgi:hypothetical protein
MEPFPKKKQKQIHGKNLCVDMVGPDTIKRRGAEALTLRCVTMIDPETRWFKMKDVKNKEAFTVATAVLHSWLNRYPWPT